jgi:NitT/TauT family transport system permease protein
LTRIAAAVFWIAAWQIAYLAVSRELLLVSPARAFSHLWSRMAEFSFWLSVGATLFRVVAGFLLALLAGTCLAALCARFKALDALVSPLLGVVRATPVASIIVLLILWLNADMMPLFVAFLMVLPVIWANVYEGIRAVDSDLLEMARLFRMPRGRVFSAVYLPSLAPYFVSASSSGLGIAWKSAIAAEVISLPREAIGRQIYNARIYLETPELFAWTIAVVILSLLLERLTTRLFRRIGGLAGG